MKNLIYRYQACTPIAFNNLKNGELFFASAKELNDPTDSIPRYVFNGSLELWRRLIHYIFFESTLTYLNADIPLTTQFSRLTQESHKVAAYIKKRLGNKDLPLVDFKKTFLDSVDEIFKNETNLNEVKAVLSYTIKPIIFDHLEAQYRFTASFALDPSNPTMWSHYANSYKGFVLIFDVPNWLINVKSSKSLMPYSKKKSEGYYLSGTSKNAKMRIFKVKYQKSPSPSNAFFSFINKFHYSESEYHYDLPLLIPGDAKEKKEKEVGLVKFTDWKYEKEVRCFFPDVFRLKNYKHGVPAALRTLKYHPKHLRGIIFGSSMSLQDKENAIMSIELLRTSVTREFKTKKEKLPDFYFFETKRNDKIFPLTIEPIGKLKTAIDGMMDKKDLYGSLNENEKNKIRDIIKLNKNSHTFDDASSSIHLD